MVTLTDLKVISAIETYVNWTFCIISVDVLTYQHEIVREL